jgi:TolB protein
MRCALSLIAVSAVLVAGHVDAAWGAFPGRDGRIAFDRKFKNPEGTGRVKRILTAKHTGRKLKAITPRCCDYPEQPAWSPHGKRIAFARGGHIFTINKKGKKQERVTKGRRYNGDRFRDLTPSWSPDGEQIVFAREYHRHANFKSDLFVVDADGSNLRPIETPAIAEFEPAWSSDGESIAFNGFTRPQGAFDDWRIYLMRPDGSDVRPVVGMLDQSSELGGWSPDGELLAFSTRTPGLGLEIHTVRPDGTELTRLTDESERASGAAFSPRGDRIVFTAGGILKLMNSDGTNVRRLLKKSRGRDSAPDWQPR